MTEVSTNSSKQGSADPQTVVKFVGHVFAYGSLLCSAFFWMAFAFHYIPRVPQVNLTGFDWFRIMAVAVILSGAAVACRAKLWKLALPVALAMFFFVLFVMGT